MLKGLIELAFKQNEDNVIVGLIVDLMASEKRSAIPLVEYFYKQRIKDTSNPNLLLRLDGTDTWIISALWKHYATDCKLQIV